MLNHETFMLLSATRSGCLKIYTISHCECSPATLIVTLHLLKLQLGSAIGDLISHSGPVHAYPPENSSFTSPLKSCIQVIITSYSNEHTRDHSTYSIFIHTN